MSRADLVHEGSRVDRGSGKREPVARVRGEQDRRLHPGLQSGLEQPPHARDVGVQGPERTRRRVVAPHQLDEAVRGDDCAEVEHQCREQRTMLARRDVGGPRGSFERGRPQDADLHRHGVTLLITGTAGWAFAQMAWLVAPPWGGAAPRWVVLESLRSDPSAAQVARGTLACGGLHREGPGHGMPPSREDSP